MKTRVLYLYYVRAKRPGTVGRDRKQSMELENIFISTLINNCC